MAKEVIVGLSGGVDSAVTAWKLKQEGYHVRGLFMKNWEDDDDDEFCSSKQDLLDAVSVAEKLSIDIDVVNFAKEYKERVFSIFLDGLKKGITPNPDILCNSEIKFEAFLKHAIGMGAEKIATGHYAKVREMNGLFQLLKGDDGTKDQSYFLCRLNQEQLSKSIFPLGSMLKSEVRKIAKDNGLHNHDRKDSTGICFIGERPFVDFINRYIDKNPGKIINEDGFILGQHDGLNFYTIGQRQGLKIGGTKKGNGQPWFVIDKDFANNQLIVGQGHDHPKLLKNGLRASEMHWIEGKEPKKNWVYSAKTRYRQPDAPCEIDQIQEDEATILFGQKQWAVTPGQSVVIYESNVCLGSGFITEAFD